MTTTTRPTATLGYRMNVLIRRRADVSREELVANWFANHMPGLVKAMGAAALAGKPHATRYITTLFDANTKGEYPWDGMAQLWWPINLPKPATAHGTKPADTFQQKAAPYMPWMVREYVVIDDAGRLPNTPNTLNEAFPFSRSGFFKTTILLKTKHGADDAAFFAHWLNVHVPSVVQLMRQFGGFRYVVAHSVEPAIEDYTGMAELYFESAEGWAQFRAGSTPDGMEQFMEPGGYSVFTGNTQFVGIPG